MQEHKEDKLPINGLHVMLRLYIKSYTPTVQSKTLKQAAGNTLDLSFLIPSSKDSLDKSILVFATAQNKLKKRLMTLLLLFKSSFNTTVV
jgi:hypothetical protein